MTPECHVGSAIYHALNLEDRPEILRPVLAAISSAFGKETLTSFQGRLRRSEKYSRVKTLTEKALAELEIDLRGRVYASLHFYDQNSASKNPRLSGLQVDVLVTEFTSGVPFPFSILVTAPDEYVTSTADLRSGLAVAWQLLESPYAFIYVGSSLQDVREELTATPTRTFNPAAPFMDAGEDEAVLARFERLGKYQGARPQIGSRVGGAYWGNFLGSDLVITLGGPGHVRQSAPAAEIYELGNGGMYLQCVSAVEYGTPTASSALARLDSFLAPIRIRSGSV